MRRVLLLGAAVVAVLALGVLGAWWFRVPLPLLPRRPGSAPHRAAPAVAVPVPAITTNLDGPGGHFAQVAVTLSVDAAVAKSLKARMAAVQDAVISDIRHSSLASLDAKGGMSGLGRAVSASVDRVLGDSRAIRAVYFTQFVVQ